MRGCEGLVFFFKQKTAYEIGLGIPAEPLFRSMRCLLINASSRLLLLISKHLILCIYLVFRILARSEERRVGKGCGSGGLGVGDGWVTGKTGWGAEETAVSVGLLALARGSVGVP